MQKKSFVHVKSFITVDSRRPLWPKSEQQPGVQRLPPLEGAVCTLHLPLVAAKGSREQKQKKAKDAV